MTVTTTAFEGSSAVISGGASGLGAATVRRLHREGLGVVIADLAEAEGRALADELGERATFVQTDVTDSETIAAAIDAAGALGEFRYAVIAHGGFTKTIDLYLNGTAAPSLCSRPSAYPVSHNGVSRILRGLESQRRRARSEQHLPSSQLRGTDDIEMTLQTGK
jgi:NAD(P)-dependent dehydrogenase (short-subunit alcohol dehydrogenase family)